MKGRQWYRGIWLGYHFGHPLKTGITSVQQKRTEYLFISLSRSNVVPILVGALNSRPNSSQRILFDLTVASLIALYSWTMPDINSFWWWMDTWVQCAHLGRLIYVIMPVSINFWASSGLLASCVPPLWDHVGYVGRHESSLRTRVWKI